MHTRIQLSLIAQNENREGTLYKSVANAYAKTNPFIKILDVT